MLKRAFAFTLAMLLFLCGSAMSEELGISNGGGVNFTSSPNEVIVSGGSFVGALDDVAPGWYSIAPADEVYTKASIFDCYSFDEPALLASYAWWEDGTSLLTTEAYPEEYVVPLWEGFWFWPGIVEVWNTTPAPAKLLGNSTMMLRAASGLSMWLRWMALLLSRKFLPSR